MTGLPTLPPVTWLTLSTEELGRWTWEHHLRWPAPLTASSVGRWEPPLDDLLAGLPARDTHRGTAAERLLETVADVLASPEYSVYAVRAAGAAESYYAAIGRGDDAVALVDTPGQARLSRVERTQLSVTLAAQLPRPLAAPATRIEIPAQTAALLAAGLARGADPGTLRSAMASAGIPDAIAGRLLAGDGAVVATGMIGAMRYEGGSATMSTRCASWTEMADGGMISFQERSGALVMEPFSAVAVARALTDALTGLRS